jgi:hypothetical protein
VSNLARALAKCQHRVRNAWHGYLTPSEYLALLENGAKPDVGRDADWAKERAASGDSNPCWVYFTVGRKLQAMLPKPKQKKVGTRTKV